MNKAIAAVVVLGGLALGGIFFIAGIFTGISISLKEERVTQETSHDSWPPKSLKVSEESLPSSSAPSVSAFQSKGKVKVPLGGVLSAQAHQEEDKALSRTEEKPKKGIEKLFEKVPEAAATAPFADALKSAVQASVPQKEEAALTASSKHLTETSPLGSDKSMDKKADPKVTSSPSDPSDKSHRKDTDIAGIPKNLQLEESSPILVTKPDKLVPSIEELFDELGQEEAEIKNPKDISEKAPSPLFIVVGTLPYEEMVRVSVLLKGRGYKVFTRKVTLHGTPQFFVLSGPFRETENAQQLLEWLHSNGFKKAAFTTLTHLKRNI
ncbi:MAG: hypothetical protein LBH38_00455 [Holosporales bacterium]|jgi:hypothetical protein|nr:hypothetical protein [Holosporales bacterium]